MSSETKSNYSEASAEAPAKIHGQIKFLMTAYEKLAEDAAEKDRRFDSLVKRVDSVDSKLSWIDSKLDTKLDSILKAIGKQPILNHESMETLMRDPVYPSYSHVRNPNFDRSRENSSLGYQHELLNLDNRENMLKKIKMPVCEGTGISEWIVDVEYFFGLGRYDEESRMDLVPLCLRGALKKWYAWVMKRGGFQSWGEFKRRLFVRFSESFDDEPSTRLFSIRQSGSVAEYVLEFEELSAQVPAISDHYLERIFYIGLNKEMKEVIRMKEPEGLSNFIAAVLKMESSTFCKVLIDSSTEDKPTKKVSNAKSGSYYNNNQKTISLDVKPQKENVAPAKPFQHLRQRRSDAELDAMRRQGLCFKCGDKWSKTHEAICPKKEFRILTVLNGFEVEVLDHTQLENQQENQLEVTEMRTLSLNAYLGIDSPKTVNMRGRIANYIGPVFDLLSRPEHFPSCR